jgi:choline-sulfatase
MRGTVLVACIVLAAACGGRARETGPAAARHVVIVTLDTLRADHVGAYGGRAAATPRLDGIAAAGLLALNASTHVPLTRPAHVTLFTGLLPPEHGVRDNLSPAVVPSVPLLAEQLKQRGFRTAAFVSSVVLAADSGLDRGFDTYGARFEAEGGGLGAESRRDVSPHGPRDGIHSRRVPPNGQAQFLGTAQKRGDRTLAEAVAWLERNAPEARAGTRLLLWLHLYDPHDPYEPPEPYATGYAQSPYAGEVAWTDELVGRLDDALARLGLREGTLLLVASDHGEGLGEHGETLHGFFTYQSTLAVPLMLRGPGVVPGTRLRPLVGLVDVAPTLLDLVGVPAMGRQSGRSFAAAARGGAAPAPAPLYAESLVPLLHFGWSDLRVVRDERWKYVQAPRPELYDLERDPFERQDLAAAQPERVRALRTHLQGLLAAEKSRASAARDPAVSPELLEKLGALGYVGGGGAADTPTPGADPKDRVEDFRLANGLMREALEKLHAGDFAGVVQRLETLQRRRIESFELHYYLARALTGLGRPAQAATHYAEAARRAPSFVAAWRGLAEAQAASRRLPEARRALESALRLAPGDALLQVQMAEVLRGLGQPQDAVGHLREAVRLDPARAAYWNTLGMTLGGSGRMAEAEQAFREAVARDAGSHLYAFNLGLALLRQGKKEEARPLLEKAAALEPRFAPAREKLAELKR